MKTFISLLKDESGATAIEYGLIAALISIAAIVLMGQIGDDLQDTFSEISGGLQSGVAGN